MFLEVCQIRRKEEGNSRGSPHRIHLRCDFVLRLLNQMEEMPISLIHVFLEVARFGKGRGGSGGLPLGFLYARVFLMENDFVPSLACVREYLPALT